MITSINEWKKQSSNGFVKESEIPNTTPAVQPEIVPHADSETQATIVKIADYAKSLELTKGQTIDLVNNVFIDPAQAPEDISVAFVQDHVGEIVAYIESLPDSDFPEGKYTYTQDMEDNDLPFECVMYVPNNDKMAKLAESLNTQIKKDKFKTIYENGIFFINSIDLLNESNKNVVFNILKECNAKNISNSLKWKRKIA